MRGRIANVIGVAFAFTVLGLAPTSARAQGAWAGGAKSLQLDLGYQYVPSSTVVVDPEEEVADRPTRNHVFTLAGSYVPIEKLSIDVAVPFAMVKYAGTDPHGPPGKWDDGSFHATLTDLRLGARYQVLDEPYVALSPHLAVSIPLMDYETIGFATGGRHLKTAHAGLSVGRTFDPVVPSLYFTGSYEFSFAEKMDATPMTEKIKQKRSDIAFELGYFFLEGKLGINLAMNWRMQHGGLSFKQFGTIAPELVANHDPLLDEDFLFLGGGASYAINERFTVTLSLRQFIRGYNTRDQDLYGLNLTWLAIP
ncbi:MAG: hypothetical protein M4D80_07520 [Myxococcota bacterium]|nr:hypothetical protein [Deltaproteobacteria bacterium]MDQ3334993.1 hypothetical protein [Myxococcota bacterium]